jgi:small subunit ribosomal protein S13
LARIAGVDLPRDKRLDIALTYIYGVGPTRSFQTCVGSRVDPSTRVRDLTDEEVVRVRDWIGANYRIEGDLRRDVNQHIKRKIDIGSYQGLRHRRSLPVHGQRTHTNGRTRKGPKRTVAGKKKAKGKK